MGEWNSGMSERLSPEGSKYAAVTILGNCGRGNESS